METEALERAYKKIADLVKQELKDKIKNGPTKAYKTGNLYDSVTDTIKPIEGGAEIAYSMNYYAQYVNDGTYAIQPPRRFIEAGLEASDAKIEQLLVEAAEQDVMVELNKQFD